METFTITCVTLEDFCDAHELNVYDVDDALLNSKYSWGTNDDTLVGYETLCDMCDTRPLSAYRGIDLMVALGS
jgi:hypothetical protein